MSTEYKRTRHSIAIFGGTFDPIHKGHLDIARKVIELDLADEVMFVPAHAPPHKIGKQISCGKTRIELIKKLIAEEKDFSVSDYEVTAAEKHSYTYNTLKAMNMAFPHSRLQLIIGMDNLNEFHTWKNAREILDTYQVLTFKRPGAAKFNYHAFQERFGKALCERVQSNTIDSDLPYSSSEIREKIKNNKDASQLLPRIVYEEIQKQGLYQND